jgi:hypothetical protein
MKNQMETLLAKVASIKANAKKVIIAVAIFATIFTIYQMYIMYYYPIHYTGQQQRSANGGTVAIPLTKLETPTAAAASLMADTVAINSETRGRSSDVALPLIMTRPFDKTNASDYYGVVEVSRTKSATLSITSPPSYFEVVVYEYPSWDVAFAETNLSELPFDFLPEGNYATVVFSVEDGIRGELTKCANSGRKPPPARSHRSSTPSIAAARDDAIASAVAGLSSRGTNEVLRVKSSPSVIWPLPVFTRVETLYVPVPRSAVNVYVSIPSYGYVIEGRDAHLGSIIHETNYAAIYRAIPQNPATINMGTEVHANNRVVSLTVVYPDIDPTNAESASPSTCLFAFSENQPPINIEPPTPISAPLLNEI